MSNFLPSLLGLFPDEPVDPTVIGEDLSKLSALAGHTTQHQWAQDAFTDEEVLKEGHPVRIREAKTTANLYQAVYNSSAATINGEDPKIRPHAADLSGGTFTVDPNLYQVPYNRGLQPVDDMRVEWTSSYPELVWIIADLQYLREKWENFGFNASNPSDYEGTKEYIIRFKARLGLNGAMLPGTGPEVVPFNTRYRGSGYPSRSLRTNFEAFSMVPAGTHVAQLFVGQGPGEQSVTLGHVLETEKTLPYESEPPNEGVVLAHRSLIVITFPLGLPLGG